LNLLSALTQLGSSDPAFALLTWLTPAEGGDYLVNLVCGIIFTVGLLSFCHAQPNPWLALTVAVPYLITIVAMGYTRQGVAIGLSMLGLVALNQQKTLRFFLWICLASAFHKSAVILIPLAFFSGGGTVWSALLGVALIGPLAFGLFVQDSVERLFSGYIDFAAESAGTSIRVVMNALPAAAFLACRNRFVMNQAQLGFWTWMSCGAMLFLAALVFIPKSTALDRLALYWIPIQIVVWSRLPQALSFGPRSETLIRSAVVIYSLLVLLVWMMYANTAFAWLPYRFYPWELIMSSLFG
jgi:hypothetical protein